MFLAQFLYRNLRGYRLLVALAVVLTLVEVIASILTIYPFKFIVDLAQNKSDSPPSGVLDSFVKNTLFHLVGQYVPTGKDPIAAEVAAAIIIILAMGLLTALLSFIQLLIASLIAKSLTARLSKQLFDHLQQLSVSWHNTQEQGDLIQRVTGNLSDLEKFAADGLVDALAAVLTVLGILTIMYFTYVPFFFVSLVLAALMFIIVWFYTGHIKSATKKEKKADGQISSIAAEAISKIMEIKAFTLERFMLGIFSKGADTRLKAGRRAGNLQAQFSPLVEMLLILGKMGIILVGVYLILGADKSPGWLRSIVALFPKAGVTAGMLTIFLFYLDKLYQPMRDLSKLAALATSASVAAERMQEVMDQPREPLDPPSGHLARLQGIIDFQDVYFCYSQNSPLVLKGITFNVPAGKKVALVGLSGSGKTTLTNLLPRFLEPLPHWGSISIDNYDITKIPLAVLRRNISVVLQESILFDVSIRENIKIGRPDATDVEMFKAAEKACIHETILKMKDGYDTKIMNHGKNLSGGQRQRIAIARAILRDSPIIIMDEPTASLDVEAESEVMRALEGLAEGRTILMITHRLSTVGKVDSILVLESGRIVEEGSYQVLKEKGGVFTNLLKIQNAYDIEVEGSTSFILTASDEHPDPFFSQAELLIEIEGQIVTRHRLDRVVSTIGRMPSNDIVIPSTHAAVQQVSRSHAKILWRNQRWEIEDLDSKHGLTINGKRVNTHTFSQGDRIYLTPNVSISFKWLSLTTQQQEPANLRSSSPMLPAAPSANPRPSSPSIAGIPANPRPSSPINPAIASSPINLNPTQPPYQPAHILVEVDGHIIQRRPLDKPSLTVGRLQTGAQYDIQIPSPHISRQTHAQIFWQNGAWFIRIINLRYEMRYNAQPVTQHTFSPGDRLYLAPGIVLIYELLP